MSAADYVIIGGGTAGCVLATRLKQLDSAAEVTLLEAGTDEHANPLITEPMGTFQLHNSKYEYNYATVPQKHYDGRRVYNSGGKVLSGSSSVNFSMWTRGGKTDYDLWAKTVDDPQWSYEGLLPYFKKTETHHDPTADPAQHGFDGPIHTTASARHYPLRDLLHAAVLEGTSLPAINDANGGNPIGVAPYTENWHPRGKRQPAGFAYGLQGVNVVTEALVKRIIFDGTTAKGAELADGRTFTARREVILSCGSIKSPQVLLLSGVGPADQLRRFGIQQVVHLPEVGQNFNDHCCTALFYKIHNPDNAPLVAGSPHWNHPSYLLGIPADLVLTAPASAGPLQAAMRADGLSPADDDIHLAPTRGHIEILPIYAPTEAPLTHLNIPFDGTCITLGVLNLLPTSRGSVTLASADPAADPLIDPNYYATEADRVVMRQGVRMALAIVESPTGRRFIADEAIPPGFTPLSSASSDAAIDERVKKVAATWFHPTGSCSMGRVVDNELRVLGAERLRVVDASVMPVPIGAHYQVVTYAVAEKAAEMIAGSWKK